jgi:hypothetical protein
VSNVVPAADRVAKWDLKYNPERIKAITETGKPKYLEHASSKFASIEQMEVAVKQVLNGEGVPVTDVASYLCFGREMWSKTQKYAGETMAKEAAVLIEKWKGRSLSQAVLEAIRSQAFSVNAPTP